MSKLSTLVTFWSLLILIAIAPRPAHGQAETQVNSHTADDQIRPAMAVSPTGSFVIAWQSPQDGYGYGIRAQRFSASGTPVGDEIAVNTVATGNQMVPDVAIDAQGNFTIVWQSDASAGSDQFHASVQARRFDASGNALGPEFQVNTEVLDFQGNPRVAVAPTGELVVVWQSNQSAGDDGSESSIQARLFDALGNPRGTDFQVNVHTDLKQQMPVVDMAADGRFVVVWQSLLQDGSGDGIYARVFDVDGSPITDERQVNESTFLFQSDAAVAIQPSGNFVVAWQSDEPDASGTDVFLRRFSATGAPLTGELRGNDYTDSLQKFPDVTADADGEVVVVWQSLGSPASDDEYYSIQGQRYSPTLSPRGGQFQLNAYTPHNQQQPAVAATPNGGFVAAWESGDQDGDRYGVFSRLYAGAASGEIVFADGFESGDVGAWATAP